MDTNQNSQLQNMMNANQINQQELNPPNTKRD